MYIIIHALMDVCSADLANKFIMILASWLIWPGSMFLVGWIGESRLVPIRRHQSKAFLPGDFAFGVMAIAFIEIYNTIVPQTGTELLKDHANSAFLWGVVLFFTTGIGIHLRLREEESYDPRAWNGPTKITHDIVGYFMIPTILVGLLWIALGTMSRYLEIAYKATPEAAWRNYSALWQASWPYWIVILLAAIFYVGCRIYDIRRPATPEDIAVRHPADWLPIWRYTKNY